jgi:hypothetical protein
MNVSVSKPELIDRSAWESLYHGYAEFYQVPMNDKTRWITCQMTVK